jgi:hypothetical protein
MNDCLIGHVGDVHQARQADPVPEPDLPRHLPPPLRLPRPPPLLQRPLHGQGPRDRRGPRGARRVAPSPRHPQKRLDHQERVGKGRQAPHPIQRPTNSHDYEEALPLRATSVPPPLSAPPGALSSVLRVGAGLGLVSNLSTLAPLLTFSRFKGEATGLTGSFYRRLVPHQNTAVVAPHTSHLVHKHPTTRVIPLSTCVSSGTGAFSSDLHLLRRFFACFVFTMHIHT